jgi:hypothetical protein
MAVAHELAGGKHGRHELGAIDDCIETALEQADELLRGVAPQARGLVIDRLELLLGDVAVIALELLLGAELLAVIGQLAAAALAMLARAVFPLVVGALRTAPNVLAKPAVDFVLGVNAFRHAADSKAKSGLSRGAPCASSQCLC